MLPKSRPSRYLEQKKLFLVVSEGKNSEPEYFGKILGKFVAEHATVKCLSGMDGNSPDKVIARLVHYRGTIRATDEQWGVADCDRWTKEQLQALVAWGRDRTSRPLRGVVLNSPMFELWLLLHFQDVGAQDSPRVIIDALKGALPDFSKKEGALLGCSAAFTKEAILAAIRRAKALCPDGQPRTQGNATNAWVLAEHILASACRQQEASTQDS